MTTDYAAALRDLLPVESGLRVEELQHFPLIDSTNRFLLDRPAPPPGRYRISLADYQSAGRGRMGKVWRAPAGSSVCLSIACAFRSVPEHFSSLGLAVGVAVVDVLLGAGTRKVAVKWPNDIFIGDAKLGGILIETRGAAKANSAIVVGLGLNFDFAGHDPDLVAPERPWPITDLRQSMDAMPEKIVLESRLIEGICDALQRFETNGLAPFVDGWNRSDWLRGRQTTVDTGSGPVSGIAQGIGNDGALLLHTQQGQRRVSSGSVVMPMPGAAP
jgi:BirA family biotin operon repressor/biotin-[acetyl-CoA-carboxylase] ligase